MNSQKAPPGLSHVAENPGTAMVMQSLAGLGSLLQPLLERQPSWEEHFLVAWSQLLLYHVLGLVEDTIFS